MQNSLNKRGMTILEMIVAMFVTSLFLLAIPPLMKVINVNSMDTVTATRAAIQQHTAINSLIKDIKSAELVEIAPDGQSATLKRSSKESGILYSIANNKLFMNNDIVLDDVISGEFTMDGTVVNVHIDLQEGMPINLMLRKPSLKKLVDDGNVVIPPDYEKSGVGLTVNGRSVSSTMTISIPVVREFDVDLSTIDPMARIVYYQIDGGAREEVRGSSTLFQTTGILKPVQLTVKVVAEDSINMQIYNITLQPQTGNNDRVPDWLWGGDEAFRTMFRRQFSVSNLDTITFGQVRGVTSDLDFAKYRVTEVGYIIGEFKNVKNMDFEDCRIWDLPPTFAHEMRNLINVNFKGCINLDCDELRDNVNNNAWKSVNCPNIRVTWP